VAERLQNSPILRGLRPAADGWCGTKEYRAGCRWRAIFHAVLGGLGLEFARRLDKGHQRQVNESGLAAPQVIVQLANGLEKRQAFDIAHRGPISTSRKSSPSVSASRIP